MKPVYMVAIGVSAAGAALLAFGGDANAAAVPVPPVPLLPPDAHPVPTGYTPTSATTQSRPVGNISTLSTSQKHDIVAIMQRQLNQLGYGPLVVDGVDGRHTATAVTEFGDVEARRVDAYLNAGMNIAHAYLSAIDDKYRENTGASRAPDFAASGSLRSLARHRGRY